MATAVGRINGAKIRRGEAGVLTGQDVKLRRNLKDLGFFYTAALTAFIVVVAGLFILWSRLVVVDLGYEMSRLSDARGVEMEKNKRLKFELMRLKSPQRLETMASKELGLVYPTPKQIVQLR